MRIKVFIFLVGASIFLNLNAASCVDDEAAAAEKQARSVQLFRGESGVARDIPRAIGLCREAAVSGNEDAKRELPIMLYWFAEYLFKGEEGFTRAIPASILHLKESADLGDEDAKKALPGALSQYGLWLMNGAEGFM